MARKIIVQERLGEPSDFNFKYVFWADVPAARQPFYADATKTSVVKDISAQELSDYRAGKFLEKSDLASYAAGTTAAAIRADLINKFNAYQTQVTAFNPFQFYGTTWDGTSWTNLGAS